MLTTVSILLTVVSNFWQLKGKLMAQNYWILVASHEHVKNGVKEGIAQVCHGKAGPLKRIKKGDWILYYSSKEIFGEKEPCQKFTAIGQCMSEEPYQFDMGGGFVPFRKKIHYLKCTEAPIIPLIPQMTVIKNKARWGGAFRFGMLKIPHQDFMMIANEMINDISQIK